MKDLEQLMDAEGQNSLWYGIKEEDQEDPDPLWRWVSEGSKMGDGAPGGFFSFRFREAVLCIGLVHQVGTSL